MSYITITILSSIISVLTIGFLNRKVIDNDIVELSESEYFSLNEEEKRNGTIYYIIKDDVY